MEGIVKTIVDFTSQVQQASAGMGGIFTALVALGLLGLLFSRIGK